MIDHVKCVPFEGFGFHMSSPTMGILTPHLGLLYFFLQLYMVNDVLLLFHHCNHSDCRSVEGWNDLQMRVLVEWLFTGWWWIGILRSHSYFIFRRLLVRCQVVCLLPMVENVFFLVSSMQVIIACLSRTVITFRFRFWILFVILPLSPILKQVFGVSIVLLEVTWR